MTHPTPAAEATPTPVTLATIRDGLTVRRNPDYRGTLPLHWVDPHNAAVDHARGAELAPLRLLRLAEREVKRARLIGRADDYLWLGSVVGPYIGAARASLNWDCGRLDCGTVDAYLCDLAERAGVEL